MTNDEELVTPSDQDPLPVEVTDADGSQPQLPLGEDVPPPIESESEIRVDGQTAFTTPPAQSMTYSQAGNWYLQTLRSIPNLIDTTQPLEAEIVQATQLRDAALSGAASALYDPELAADFNNQFQGPSVDQLRATLAQQYSGELLDQHLLSAVLASTACFIAGTLVHTESGLVPIEQIKVGDRVLSKPECGIGETRYQRVVATHVHEDREVWYIEYGYALDPPLNRERERESLIVTADHPFWVTGYAESQGIISDNAHRIVMTPLDVARWLTVRELESYFEHGVMPVVQMRDGRPLFVERVRELGRMQNPRQAIYMTPHFGIMVPLTGVKPSAPILDFNQAGPHQYIDQSTPIGMIDTELNAVGRFDRYRTRVYNLEVENDHTYFVGRHGVWVHNACTFVQIQPPAFASIAEAQGAGALLQQNSQGTVGLSMVVVKERNSSLAPGMSYQTYQSQFPSFEFHLAIGCTGVHDPETSKIGSQLAGLARPAPSAGFLAECSMLTSIQAPSPVERRHHDFLTFLRFGVNRR